MTQKIYLICLIVAALASLSICNVHAQVVQDDFSDGNYTDSPTWTGSAADFIVNAGSELQLNAAAAGQSYLATSFAETSLDTKEWSLWISQTFSGSDNNHSRFYLASSSPVIAYSGINGSGGVQGYFLRFGEGGSADAVRLFRDDGAGSPVLLASAPDGGISASFAIRVKVARSAGGEWQLFIDPNGGTSYGLVASANDATYTSTSSVAWVCTYTITNADNFYLDDVSFGDLTIDSTAPSVTSTEATSGNTLDVSFSEPVSEATCTLITNYNVAGMGNPVSALRDNLNFGLVHLTFSGSFTPNETMTLSISNVEDEAGNVMTDTDQEFIWFVPGTPSFRSVVFNEILADPTPVVALPEGEYIELFNAGESAYDLLDWQLINSTTPKSLPSYLLEPGEYVILCDATLAGSFSPSIGISSFTALTNDTDSLTLLDNLGNVIDVLVYESDWYMSPEKQDGGWSLEQINPFLPCQSAANWSESNDPSGGSPAIQNSIFSNTPDTESPSIADYSLNDPGQIQLTFTEPIDPATADVANWDVIPFNSVQSFQWSADFTTLLINLVSDIAIGQQVTLTASGFSDCSGNASGPVSLDFVLGFVPEPGDLIITEIMADPDPSIGAPPAEYIELYNRSTQLLDLNGILINENPVESQVMLYPGEYVVIGDNGDALAFLSVPNTHLLSSFPSLTNSGMELILADPMGTTLDVVEYDLSWYRDNNKSDGGWSLERINLNDPCSDADNWTASTSPTGGTAGLVNSVNDPSPDTAAPQFLYLLMEPQESVTLVFNEPLSDDFSNADWLINGEPVTGVSIELNYANPRQLIVYVGELEAGLIYTWELTGITDCWGNTVSPLNGILAQPEEAAPGDILVNEILFDPLDGGSDFVELYNASQKTISLAGWMAGNDDPADNEVFTTLQLPLFPGEYLVLTEDGADLPQFYPFTRTDRILRVEDLPTYAVSGSQVAVVMPDGTTSDRMTYSEQMHYPLLNTTDGVSLERIASNRDSEDPTNWHSASQSQGFATPGYINSQTQNIGFDPDQLIISPEIFSPDNDGFEDVVTISYVNDSPGWVANVTIFDSEGRERRKLVSNELLGTSGSISWDGFSDDRILCPIGRYVIYFEVFSTGGDVRSFRKTCVLARKLN